MKKSIIFLSLLTLFFSCEKEIEITTEAVGERIVIEGNISNALGESFVYISKTLGLTEAIENPKISGAQVTITDNSNGTIDTLSETLNGVYTNPLLTGTVGHSYTLNVLTEGNLYSANSTMPQLVILDSVIQLEDSFSAGGSFGFGEDFYNISPVFSEPPTKNYYQFIVRRNDTLLNDLFILNDEDPLNSLRISASIGDSITINLQSIDEFSFEYLFGVSENIQQSSAAPSNPKSNIDNGAFGFFKAHTTSKKKLVIK